MGDTKFLQNIKILSIKPERNSHLDHIQCTT
jgi:hypothetical protein